jgi:hypothetical protein
LVLQSAVGEWVAQEAGVSFKMQAHQICEAKRAQIPAVACLDQAWRLQLATKCLGVFKLYPIRYKMAVLRTVKEFEDELDALVVTNADDAGLIDALVEELGADGDVLDTLSDEVPKWHYTFNPPFEIKRFAACWKTGRRIYTLKPYDENGHLINFRLFIGYDITTHEYFVLTVQPRATCYDTTTDEYRGLCDRYDKLGIPAIRRIS